MSVVKTCSKQFSFFFTDVLLACISLRGSRKCITEQYLSLYQTIHHWLWPSLHLILVVRSKNKAGQFNIMCFAKCEIFSVSLSTAQRIQSTCVIMHGCWAACNFHCTLRWLCSVIYRYRILLCWCPSFPMYCHTGCVLSYVPSMAWTGNIRWVEILPLTI